jgi:hypothetical protein
MEPTIATFSSRASREKLSLVGPGTGVEQLRALFPAKILRAEQFRHRDNLRAFRRRLANAPLGLGEILGRIFRTRHLNEAERELPLMVPV